MHWEALFVCGCCSKAGIQTMQAAIQLFVFGNEHKAPHPDDDLRIPFLVFTHLTCIRRNPIKLLNIST